MIRIEGIPILAARLEHEQRTKKTHSDMTDYGTGRFSVVNEWAVLPAERVSKRSSDEPVLRNASGVEHERNDYVNACC